MAIRKYMHIKRILFKFEDSGMAIAPVGQEPNKNTHTKKECTVWTKYRKIHET